jgi:hypothetical protein
MGYGVAYWVWRCSYGVALLMGCGVAQGVWRSSWGEALLIGCGVALGVWRSLLVIACLPEGTVGSGFEYRSGTLGDSSLSNSDEEKRRASPQSEQ